MLFHSIFVVLLFCCNVFGSAVNHRVIRQAEKMSCLTPSNQPGTCIRINDCPNIYEILKNSSQIIKDPNMKFFLQNSLCGREKNGYPKVCCSLDSSLKPPSTVITTNNTQNNQTVRDYSACGKSDQLKIVNGQGAALGDFPWMVVIGYRRGSNPAIRWECGGSLISDRWVVTAAHCTESIGTLILTTVRVGDLNLNDTIQDGTTPIDIEVDKIIPHPQQQVRPLVNDIALLHLKDPVIFSQSIRPICVPKGTDEFKSDEFYSNKSPFIAGWGHTRESQQSAETRSNHLLRGQLDIVELKVCDKSYRSGNYRAVIDNRVLCASGNGTSTCQGDSGGPLMLPIKGRFNLAGIVSFGIGCKNDKYPSVYTRVAVFADWIRSTTGLAL